MKLFYLVAGINLFLVGQLWAGTAISGGGTALVCFAENDEGKKIVKDILTAKTGIPDEAIDKIKSIETLDLYEAKLKRGFEGQEPQIAEPKKDEDFLKFTRRVLDRFNGFISLETGRLEVPFETRNIIRHKNSLSRIYDESFVGEFTNSNCLIAQVAAQDTRSRAPSLHIDDRLFSHPLNSEQSKAALILHEIIYYVDRKVNKAEDSAKTRAFVALMLSNETIEIEAIADLIDKVGITNASNGLIKKLIEFSGLESLASDLWCFKGYSEMDAIEVNNLLREFNDDLVANYGNRFTRVPELDPKDKQCKNALAPNIAYSLACLVPDHSLFKKYHKRFDKILSKRGENLKSYLLSKDSSINDRDEIFPYGIKLLSEGDIMLIKEYLKNKTEVLYNYTTKTYFATEMGITDDSKVDFGNDLKGWKKSLNTSYAVFDLAEYKLDRSCSHKNITLNKQEAVLCQENHNALAQQIYPYAARGILEVNIQKIKLPKL